MEQGYVKIFRKLRSNSIASSIELLGLMTYLLLNATYVQKKIYYNNQEVLLNPGELIISQKKLSASFGISIGKLNGMLATLKRETICETIGSSKFTVVRFINWELYQGNLNTEMKTEGKQNENRMKQIKKGNKGNKSISTDSNISTDLQVVQGGEESSLTELEVKKKARRDEVISMIDTIKNACISKNIAYAAQDAFKYARLMVLSDEYERCSKMVEMTKEQYSVAILMASIAIKYWKGPCTGPRDIYLNHAEIYNQFMLAKEEKGRGSTNHEVF